MATKITLCLVLTSLFFYQLLQYSHAASRYLLPKPQCNQTFFLKLDQSIAKMIGMGPNGRLFPVNHQQLKGYCKETSELINYADNFFKICYKKEIRDLANVLIYSLKSNVRQFCRKKSKKLNKLLKVAKCINANFVKHDTCITMFTNRTKVLINVPDDSVKIRYACCNYVFSIRCAEEYIDRVACGRDNKGLILDFINGIFGSFTDFMCGEYNESTTLCDEISPPPKPTKPNRKNYLSFVTLLLDLLESFENFHLQV